MAGFITLLFSEFFSNTRTLIVLGLIGVFTLVCCAIGLRGRVLSRAAITNTLASLGMLCSNLLLAPFVYFFAEFAQNAYARLGIPAIKPEIWSDLPWLLVAIIALIGKDFSDYWVHRALHTPLGWPIHAVHHSDSHVNGFTTFRVHLFELMLMKLFYITLLSWLGIPPELVASAYILASMHNAYVHFEVDIDHGRFNWLLASPRFHRWHHADVPEIYGKNLANMIPAWDMLFGTYHAGGRCDAKMGVLNEGVPDTDVARLVLLPFSMWYRQARSALAQLARRSASPGP